MSWLQRKRESRFPSAEVVETFEGVMRRPDIHQIAIGHTLNLVTSLFTQRFGGIDGFKALAQPKQMEYISSLNTMFDKLKDNSDARTAVWLFKVWLGAEAAGETALSRKLRSFLYQLSQRADGISNLVP